MLARALLALTFALLQAAPARSDPPMTTLPLQQAWDEVPSTVTAAALRALGAEIMHHGDRLVLGFDGGCLLWVEIRHANGLRVAAHHFQPTIGQAGFWLANGQSTAPPKLGKPVTQGAMSSPFGMRNDTVYGPIKAARGQPSSNTGAGRSPRVVRAHPLLRPTASFHPGIDFAAPQGTPVVAAGDGTVRHAGRDAGLGNSVTIEHGGDLATRYGHLEAIAATVAIGTRVRRGELIGFVGSTGLSSGPHLHYELLVRGAPTNPVVHASTLPKALRGSDLRHFRLLVTERERTITRWLLVRSDVSRGLVQHDAQ